MHACVRYYERVADANLGELDGIYAPDACFRDPFNDVRGVPAIRAIFARMFEQLEDCRFAVTETVADRGGAMMVWNMTFRFRRFRPGIVRTIHGVTHLRYDSHGRVAYHRDYWDAADELYSKLPSSVALMRFLKREWGEAGERRRCADGTLPLRWR